MDSYEYYSEQDPNGDEVIDNALGDPDTGGYLKQTTRDTASGMERNSGTDPTPVRIRQRYLYDAVGNVTQAVDGRGIVTLYEVNALNQVVQVTRAAANSFYDLEDPLDPAEPAEPLDLVDFAYRERTFYDFNNNVVLRQVEDRGNTSNVDGDLPATELPLLEVLASGLSNGSNTSNTLNDTTQSWTTDEWAGALVVLSGGTGAGQVRTVLSNSATELVLDSTWDVVPDTSSSYALYPVPSFDPIGAATAYVDTVTKYDILDRPVEVLQEVTQDESDPLFLRTRSRYDPNGNLVLTILPEGNATSALYDERDLLFQSVSGTVTRPSLGLYRSDDPTTFDRAGAVEGTEESIFTFSYDGNRNRAETIDAADTDGETANNAEIPGTSPQQCDDVTFFTFDGFDRLRATTDALDNHRLTFYDPASNVVRVVQEGDPADDGVAGDENRAWSWAAPPAATSTPTRSVWTRCFPRRSARPRSTTRSVGLTGRWTTGARRRTSVTTRATTWWPWRTPSGQSRRNCRGADWAARRTWASIPSAT